jgi:hypothetical protein
MGKGECLCKTQRVSCLGQGGQSDAKEEQGRRPPKVSSSHDSGRGETRKGKSCRSVPHYCTGLNYFSSQTLPTPAGVPAEVDKALEPKIEVLVKLFRTILYIAKNRRPLSDYNGLRELQAENGQADMDAVSGVLSDPSANYTSPEFVTDVLKYMTDILGGRFAAELTATPAISLVADEAHGADNKAHLIVYTRFVDAFGLPLIKFLGLIEMRLDEEKVRDWAEGLGHAIPAGTEVKMKGGLNMAYLIFTHVDGSIYKEAIDWHKVLSCALDGCT